MKKFLFFGFSMFWTRADDIFVSNHTWASIVPPLIVSFWLLSAQQPSVTVTVSKWPFDCHYVASNGTTCVVYTFTVYLYEWREYRTLIFCLRVRHLGINESSVFWEQDIFKDVVSHGDYSTFSNSCSWFFSYPWYDHNSHSKSQLAIAIVPWLS